MFAPDIRPTPMTEPTTTWTHEIGMPMAVNESTTMAADSWDVKHIAGFIATIFDDIVWMTR